MKRLLVALALGLCSRAVLASELDPQGRLVFAAEATHAVSFEADESPSCSNDCSFERLDEGGGELALHGAHFVRVTTGNDPFDVELERPADDTAMRARAWVRHARASVRIVVDAEDRPTEVAYLFPTGRVTSDGWVELESNVFSYTALGSERMVFRVTGTAVDVDAIELVAEGSYQPEPPCLGARDDSCGAEAVCLGERCRAGARFVPPLPAPEHRQAVARYLTSRIEIFYGGRFSRKTYLPGALARMQDMREATTPWQFWSAFAHGIRKLNDWHTSVGSAIETASTERRMGVCFIEGVADLSQGVWPSTAGSADVLVSHVGPEANLGLSPGDRLVLVDGEHPLIWARKLHDVHWGYHVATDPDVDADLAESMRSLIPSYAKSFTIARCQGAAQTCQLETVAVDTLPTSGQRPACDNRPAYHLANPPEDNPGAVSVYHQLPFFPWRDLVVDSAPGEQIYGMTWDSLYGTAQGLTPYFIESNQFFKDNARGVILDHRAGNGGTKDAAQAITQLVRSPTEVAAGPAFPIYGNDDGPVDVDAAKALFEKLRKIPGQVYSAGGTAPDTALPVALIIHRDASASDFLPLGMKGAPKARIFGPQETGGGFSSFYNYSYWSRLRWQVASGDTVTPDGETLIGSGVMPDEIVMHSESSLSQGKDALYEAALDWVRKNLKP